MDNIITRTPSEHSHPATPIENSVVKIKEEIKIRAEQSEQLPTSIINDVTSDMCLSVAGALPKKESLKRTVHRKRPVVREEDLFKTPRGDDFLLYENEDISIFGTKKNLEILSKRTEWFCDGTFDSAPLGKQLYSIHALLSENKTVPLLYCITSSKSEGNYNSIFKFIREVAGHLNVTSITVDFEKAAINAIRTNFLRYLFMAAFFTLANVYGGKSNLLDCKRGTTIRKMLYS